MRRPLIALALSLNLPLAAAPAAATWQDAPPAKATGETVGQQIPPTPQLQDMPILPNVLFDRIPGVNQTPTPDWIKPGTRLVFFSTNATTQTNPGQMGMTPDPNGQIVDNNGKRWTLNAGTGDSGGGVGYTVIDVIAYEPPPSSILVLDHRAYFLPNVNKGPAILVSSQGEIIHCTGGDFFLHPRLLGQVPSVSAQNVNIIRQQYDLRDKRYNAMRVTVRTSGNGISSNVYDLTSGVLLFSRSAGTTSQGQTLDPNGNIVNASATASGTHTFIGTREVNLPWRNSQMPAWVKQTRKLHYAGQMISRTTSNEGLPDNTTGVTADIVLKKAGANWSMHEMTSVVNTNVGIQDIPSVTQLACGSASCDGVWKDPAFLKQLKTGQTLDQDQTIGTQSMVEFAGAGNDGRPIVAITILNEGLRSTSVYDASDGKLIQMIRTEPIQGMPMMRITQLNLVGME